MSMMRNVVQTAFGARAFSLGGPKVNKLLTGEVFSASPLSFPLGNGGSERQALHTVPSVERGGHRSRMPEQLLWIQKHILEAGPGVLLLFPMLTFQADAAYDQHASCGRALSSSEGTVGAPPGPDSWPPEKPRENVHASSHSGKLPQSSPLHQPWCSGRGQTHTEPPPPP